MTFYDMLEKLCNERGITPTKAARDIGVAQPVVSQWKKRGSTPKAETVQKLADYFRVSVDYLLGKTELPFPGMTGKTEHYEPWTQADEMILRAGGFRAVAEFNFLSEADKAEALKDINKFVEFTLSKYKQQEAPESALDSTEDRDTTPLPDAPETPPEGGENR